MFRTNRASRRRSRDRLRRQIVLRGEILERRVMLAADIGGLLGIENLEIDTESYDPSGIIVRYRQDASDDLLSLSLAADIVDNSSASPLLDWMPSLQHVELPTGVDFSSALNAFRMHPDVLYAEPDYQLTASVIPNDPRFGEMWPLENTGQTGGVVDADIDAAKAWDVQTGNGTAVVAVIDTGVDYLHPDLAGNIWVNPGEIAGDGIDNDVNGYVDDVYGYDFANNDGNPMDDNGHGTHVAGTIGAVGNNGTGVTGINWNTRIMALKFLNAQGSGSTSDAIEAINYAVANGASISNNSWGGDPYSQSLFDAIESAREAKHIFVAAAGNGNLFGIGQDNDATLFYPASYNLDNIVAVAAVDHSDNLATFSNYGATTVDLAAPGVNILSTTRGGSYGLNTGTSMAAPHVAGVLSLVWDAHTDWTYDQVINKVLTTVEAKPQLNGLMVTGGRLNVAAALDNPEPPPPPPPNGSLPLVEDFTDGQADFFDVEAGNWSVSSGRFNVSAAANNDDLPTISTLRLDATPPDDFEVRTRFNADQGRIEFFGIVLSDFLTNGMIVFDYQSSTDFKFAGPDMDQDRWVIGHRDAGGWSVDASLSQSLDAQIDYDFGILVRNQEEVQLLVNGIEVLQFDFGTSVSDGEIGLGTRNAGGHFDNFIARGFTAPSATVLPASEDFDDGQADNLLERDGLTQVVDGRLEVAAMNGAGVVSTLVLSDPLPVDFQVGATINADRASGSRLSNGLLVFDYQDNQNFKFAGAYVGGDNWVIGHRAGNQWTPDVLVSSPLDALVDYDLEVKLEGGNVKLFADGTLRATHTYAEALHDGAVGVAIRNGSGRFDDFTAAPYTPPSSATLPHQENFDSSAAFFEPQAGSWSVTAGRYQGVADAGGDSVSTLRLDSVPANVEIAATINADAASSGRLSNGLIVFDYHSPSDFRFAGAYVGGDNWVIGRRTSSGWIADVLVSSPIDPFVDVDVKVVIENDASVTVYADGVPMATRNYASSLTDGSIGVGTRDAIARFDDFSVRELTPATLPYQQAFADSSGDDFFDPRSGDWTVAGGEYEIIPSVGADGISTLRLNSVPDNLEFEVTINANGSGGGYLSNAMIIFDYQHAGDFKFAGAYVGGNNWVIGHRTSSGWIPDKLVSGTINTLSDYDLKLVLEGGTKASLYANGSLQATHTFGASLSDGKVGLGTRNAISRFDDLAVRQPGGAQSLSQGGKKSSGGEAAIHGFPASRNSLSGTLVQRTGTMNSLLPAATELRVSAPVEIDAVAIDWDVRQDLVLPTEAIQVADRESLDEQAWLESLDEAFAFWSEP